MKVIVSLFLCIAMSASALAATSEGFGMGGWIEKFQPEIDRANALALFPKYG